MRGARSQRFGNSPIPAETARAQCQCQCVPLTFLVITPKNVYPFTAHPAIRHRGAGKIKLAPNCSASMISQRSLIYLWQGGDSTTDILFFKSHSFPAPIALFMAGTAPASLDTSISTLLQALYLWPRALSRFDTHKEM